MAEPPTDSLSRRRFLTRVAGIAGVAITGPTFWKQVANAANPPTNAHLAFGGDPATGMAVSWMTDGTVAHPRLRLGHANSGLGQWVEAESRSAPGASTVHHHVRLSGLHPGTRYDYRVAHDGAQGPLNTFITAPRKPEPFTFTAFGDHSTTASAFDMTRLVAAQSPAFHVLVGDISYASLSGGGLPSVGPTAPQPAIWDAWLSMTSGHASGVPWMVGVGNHEIEEGNGDLGYDAFLARFTLPASGAPNVPTSYWYRYGSVGIVIADANDVSYEIPRNYGYSNGAQDQWLAATLTMLRADASIDWVVVGFHHCAFCSSLSHGSDGGVRNHWTKLFDENQVDLVINGHNHNYERSHLVRNGTPTVFAPTGATLDASLGTTYVTAGGGGQEEEERAIDPASYVTHYTGQVFGLREPELATWSSVRFTQSRSLLRVDVVPPDQSGHTELTLRALALDGTEVDRLKLVRSSTAGRGRNAISTA